MKASKTPRTNEVVAPAPYLDPDALALLRAHVEQRSTWLGAATDLRETFGASVPWTLDVMRRGLKVLSMDSDAEVALHAAHMHRSHYNTKP